MGSLNNGSNRFTGYISPAVEDAIKNDQGGTYVLDFMKGNSVAWHNEFMNMLWSIQGYSSNKTQILTNEAGVFKWVDQT